MAFVHVSQFYPCSRVDMACELYYICELGKYSCLDYERPVSIEGVTLVTKALEKSPVYEYFKMAVRLGWVVGVSSPMSEVEPKPDLKLLSNVKFYISEDTSYTATRSPRMVSEFVIPDERPVSFKSEEDGDLWVLDMTESVSQMAAMNKRSISRGIWHQIWVSLFAFVAVHRYFNDYPKMFRTVFDFQTLSSNTELTYLILLSEDSECLNGWTDLVFGKPPIGKNALLQLGYYSWHMRGVDYGYMLGFSTADEKTEYMKQLDIQVGDVVYVYRRSETIRNNYIKNISGCFVAIIRDNEKINGSFFNLFVEELHNPKTYRQAYEDFLGKTTLLKRELGEGYYNKLRSGTEHLSSLTTGVGYMLWDEPQFIIPLDAANDEVVTWVSCEELGRLDRLRLDAINFIYWVLMDYGFDFDRERYLQRYFKRTVPLYDLYHQGEDLPWYVYEKG